MERQPENNEAGDDTEPHPWRLDAERQQPPHPRIYVVDLASTERGIDHGLWVDANQSASEIDADIGAMLESSPVLGAKLWTIRSAEDFGGIDLSQVTDSAVVADLARGIIEHGRAFAAWARSVQNDRARLAEFRDVYTGSHQSQEAWAWSLVESLSWHQELDRRITDELMRPYVVFDYEAVAKDASASWVVVSDPDGTVHVFAR
ncbi:antirestriction protein ArdA [Amycolatopsis sp. CB00013]|uniref:antirestriction protein ArdA n=1 Tax=Amycolatopsis sp. CB00013 TaxID=1703945 RepID=UPI000939BF7F|nr:antirestriction protein ArdA [Amycolatopsis sp. CB00013]